MLPWTAWVRWCPPVLLLSWSWFSHSLCADVLSLSYPYYTNTSNTMLGRTETWTRQRMYFQSIRTVRDISQDDRASIATCSLRTSTESTQLYYGMMVVITFILGKFFWRADLCISLQWMLNAEKNRYVFPTPIRVWSSIVPNAQGYVISLEARNVIIHAKCIWADSPLCIGVAQPGISSMAFSVGNRIY